MSLSSMFSKVSKEFSNFDMDLDGNSGKKKKKDSYQEESYGGGGYSNGGYQSGGGYDSRYGAPQHQPNHYAPPSGPPPGQYVGHSQYGPPGPPPGQYVGHSQYGPPGGAPQGRSRLPFNPKMEMWTDFDSDGNIWFHLGDHAGGSAFAARMPLSSGRLVVNVGGERSSNVLGEAKDAGFSKSSAVVSLPNGFSCDLSKSGLKQIGQKHYTFTVPTDSGRKETFMWKLDDQGIKDMLKGKSTGWSLIRAEEHIKPTKDNPTPPAPALLGKFTDKEKLGMSTKSKVGFLELVDEGASGSLGGTWASVVVVAILKIKAKQLERKIIEEVAGA